MMTLENEMQGTEKSRVAYFSMEIALDPSIPTYAGGLGVVAGDTLRSLADLSVAAVAVTLVHRKGYFRQRLDERGNQFEEPAEWRPEEVLQPMEPVASLTIEGRPVYIRAWRYLIRGISGHTVPVYLLDTSLPENSPWDRTLTDCLYGGDNHYRLCQEAVLGMGGVGILRKLGYIDIESYHMNEGHSALLTLALLEQRLGSPNLGAAAEQDIEAVRHHCVFTTHTPVPAGHDQFPKELMCQVLGEERAAVLEATHCCPEKTLNMTYLALRFSHYINGVAMLHGEISHGMFPNYPVRAITNGVHAVTWTAPPFRELYDRHIPEWRRDNLYLRYAVGIPLEEIREAHARAKRTLLEEIKKTTGVAMDEAVMTAGFARRATAYKRADLLFSNPERLKWIARHVGPLQLVYAGKAHPQDQEGKGMIRRVVEAAASLKESVRIVYLEDYDIRWGQLMSSGVDLWLNTPHRPYEASGTSGMKAALNGVPSFSVLDGRWIEGCVEGATGWAIGYNEGLSEDHQTEVGSLYDKLERVILPMFYGRPVAFAEVMRLAIALNGSFFNTQRMVSQYVSNAYSSGGN
jgi:starch phosphorylase